LLRAQFCSHTFCNCIDPIATQAVFAGTFRQKDVLLVRGDVPQSVDLGQLFGAGR
jgi:hypothetical protein